MTGKIQKWGNSLALRIPKSIAADLQVRNGSEVDISVNGGTLTVKPRKKKYYRLKDLLAKIKPENLHGEIDFGPPVGRELW